MSADVSEKFTVKKKKKKRNTDPIVCDIQSQHVGYVCMFWNARLPNLSAPSEFAVIIKLSGRRVRVFRLLRL